MEILPSTVKPRTRERKTYTQPALPVRILTRSRTSQSNPISRRPTELFSGSNCERISRIYSVKDLRARRIFTPDVNSIPKYGEDETKSLDPSPVFDSTDAVRRDLNQKPDPDLGSVEPEPKDELIAPSSTQPIPRNKMGVNPRKRRKVFAGPSYSLKRMLPFLMDIANESGDSKFEIQGVASSSRMLKSGAKFECRVKPTENLADQNIGDTGNEVDLTSEKMKQIGVQAVSFGNRASKPDSSVEQACGQVMPPDPSIFSKMDVVSDEKKIRTQSDTDFSPGGDQSNHGCLKESRGHANVRVLNPRSRLRLFENPNSVSYRRLLPFLMNMSKEDSCDSTMDQQPSSLLKSYGSSDPPLGSSPEKIKHLTEDQEDNILSPVSSLSKSSSQDSDCIPILPSPFPTAYFSMYNNPSSFTSEIHSDSSNMPIVLKQGSDESESNSSKSCDYIKSSALKEHNLVLPIVDNGLSKELTSEDELSAYQKTCTDVGEVCDKTGNYVEKLGFKQTSVMVVLADTMASPSSVVVKGILKRNPRTCRRFCNSPNLLKQGSDESRSGSTVSPYTEIKKTAELRDPNLVFPPSPIGNGLSRQFTSEEHGAPANQMECFDVVEVRNNSGESVEKLRSNQSSTKVAESDMMVSPSNGVLKGILKKNPRGCRGLCNCLNCASFRLHAERAFEFSRNQMHGSEEVASDLINELTALRLILEKSVQADDLAAIQHRSVREACKKALQAENLAKERLKQMNYDLNVHCRIPALLQPQVTFSRSVKDGDISIEKQI